MSRDNYKMKVMDHLNNIQFNRKRQNDLAKQLWEEVEELLVGMVDRQVVDTEMFDFFHPKNTTTSLSTKAT